MKEKKPQRNEKRHSKGIKIRRRRRGIMKRNKYQRGDFIFLSQISLCDINEINLFILNIFLLQIRLEPL